MRGGGSARCLCPPRPPTHVCVCSAHDAPCSCAVPWPRDPRQLYPEPLHQLVMLCLQRDPAQRPPLADVVLRAQQLAAMDLPGPRSAQLLP